MRRRFLCLGTALLVGCTAPDRPRPAADVATEWQLAGFHVRFTAGPRRPEERTAAAYQITCTDAAAPGHPLVMASAHSLDRFASVTNADPREWIRLVAAPDRRSLLIEEEIPNDCGPCANHLLVRVGCDGALAGTWLRLPSRTTGAPGGIDEDLPRVRALDGETIVFGYSDGSTVRTSIARVPTGYGPVPPG